MLTQEDVKLSLQFFHIFSKLGLLPLDVDVSSARIQVTISFRKHVFKFFWALSFIHLIFLFTRLVQSILVPEYFVPTDFPLHLLATLGIGVGHYWMVLLFTVNPDLLRKVFHEIFKSHAKSHSWMSRWKEYSLQDSFNDARKELSFEENMK
ncbi:unnamed protein product, partial [Allacma fusca]